MKTMNSTFRLTALAAALVAVFGTAQADDSELVMLSKPDSTVSLGIGGWSGDRQQFGIYDGMRDEGVYGLLDADVVKRNDETGTWINFNTRNLGLDSREARIEILRQGDIGGFLEYSQTPRNAPFTVNTGLQGLGTANQTVSGAGVNAFPKVDVDLKTTREMTRLGFYKSLMPGLEFKVDFKNEEKTGNRIWGYGGQPYFLAEPIDSTIRQLETVLQYTGKRLQLSGGYYGSWFDQNNGGMVTAQANGVAVAANGTNPIRLSQPLSNQAHQVFLDGGFSFTPTTRGTFKLAYSQATQNEHLPTSDFLLPTPAARSSLDGKIDTTLVQLGLTSRPIPKLSVTANLRYYDWNDKTPLTQFISTGIWNTPQSFTKTSGKLEGTYRLPLDFRVTAGVDYYTQDRSVPVVGNLVVPFRSQLDETTYKLQLRRSLGESVNGSIAYLHSDRSGSTRDEAADALQNQYNPMHIADRKRDKVRAAVDWEPLDKLSLQFAVESAQDDYSSDRYQFGLQDGEALLFSADASYTFNEDWRVFGWYAYEDTKSRQIVASTPVNNVNLSERSNSVGLGLRGKVSSKVTVGADADWVTSTSKYDQTGPFTATLRPLPDIENKVTRFKMNGTYALNKSSDLRLDLIHERWQSDDWTWSFAGGSPFCYTGTPNSCSGIDGTTVIVNPKQNATFVGLRYIYKFQ